MSLFPVFAPVAAVPSTVTYLSSDSTGTDATEFTFSSVGLGAAAADRKIVISVYGSNYAQTVSGVTIGGVSATQLLVLSFSNFRGYMFQAVVPTGTTGDIVVTWTGTQQRMGFDAYRCTGLATNVTDSEASPTRENNPTYDIDVPAGGVCISLCASELDDLAWTGLTERSNSEGIESTEIFIGSAADRFDTEQTNLTVALTASPNGFQLVASWGPA